MMTSSRSRFDDVRGGAFFDFHGDEDIAAFEKLAGRVFELRRQAGGEFFVVLFHAVHHERHPAGAGFEVGDAQLGKFLEHALEHHVGDLEKQSDGMFEHVRFEKTARPGRDPRFWLTPPWIVSGTSSRCASS